eukprot:1161697-Pelagomonas_calceolata.AAC.7
MSIVVVVWAGVACARFFASLMLDALGLKHALSACLPLTQPSIMRDPVRCVPGIWTLFAGLMLDASGLKHALSACLPLTQPSCVALFGVSLAPGALTDPSGTQHAQAEGPKVSGAHTVCEAEVGQGEECKGTESSCQFAVNHL